MPKIPARNQPNYKIGGSQLNEYEFNQQHGQLTTDEKNPFELAQAQTGGGEGGEETAPQSPQELEAERIRQVIESAQRKAHAGRKGGKATVSGVHLPPADESGTAGGGDKGAAKSSAKKAVAGKQAGGSTKSAAKKSAVKKSAAKQATAKQPAASKSAAKKSAAKASPVARPAAAKQGSGTKVAATKTATKSATKSATKTATKSATKTATKSATKTATKSATKTATKSGGVRGGAVKKVAGQKATGGGILSAVAARVGRVVALVEGAVKPGKQGGGARAAKKKSGARRS